MEKTFWQAIVEADYALPPGHSIEESTPELLSYLGSTYPVLSDEFAYPILDSWIERGYYSSNELRNIGAQMVHIIFSTDSSRKSASDSRRPVAKDCGHAEGDRSRLL